jgi:hypothetical protein
MPEPARLSSVPAGGKIAFSAAAPMKGGMLKETSSEDFV